MPLKKELTQPDGPAPSVDHGSTMTGRAAMTIVGGQIKMDRITR